MKIAYKIITPILTLAIFPVLFFLPLLHLNITSTLAGSLSSNLGIREYTSLYQLLKMGSGMDETQRKLWKSIGDAIFDKEGTIGSVLTNTKWLYFFAVFAVLMLVLALVSAVLAAATRRYGLTAGFGLGAAFSAVAMNKSFDAFARPLLSGEIGISSFLGNSGSGGNNIFSSLLGNLAKVESLELGVAYSLAAFLLFTAAVFSIIMLIVRKVNK